MNTVGKSVLLAAVAAACMVAPGGEGEDCGGWYAGGAAQLVLPQGGARMRRLAGGVARAGFYVTDALALEGEAAWMENVAGLSVRALWHLHGWNEFNMLFGYERFDPFVTAGARGWIHDGQVGPSVGVGAFCHLTDSLSLRFDADATLGIDTRTEMAFCLSVGLQWFF